MGISEGAADAAGLEFGLANKVRAFLGQAREAGKDGLTFTEFSELLFTLLRILVAAADTVPAAGPQRKQWVLHAIGVLYDDLIDLCIPIYLKPFWIFFKPAFRSLVLKLADGAIESVLPLVRGAT